MGHLHFWFPFWISFKRIHLGDVSFNFRRFEGLTYACMFGTKQSAVMISHSSFLECCQVLDSTWWQKYSSLFIIPMTQRCFEKKRLWTGTLLLSQEHRWTLCYLIHKSPYWACLLGPLISAINPSCWPHTEIFFKKKSFVLTERDHYLTVCCMMLIALFIFIFMLSCTFSCFWVQVAAVTFTPTCILFIY